MSIDAQNIQIAAQEQQTISSVIRKQRLLEALERIQQRRQAILKRRNYKPLEIDPVTLINQMRDERDAEITMIQ